MNDDCNLMNDDCNRCVVLVADMMCVGRECDE